MWNSGNLKYYFYLNHLFLNVKGKKSLTALRLSKMIYYSANTVC